MKQGIKAVWQSAGRHKWLILLCLAALALRLYKLDVIPYGFNTDEAGSAYDAWCLANYGVDRNGTSFPVYFLNYGDGQNALYTYLCALLIKCFGLSLYVVRLPAVFSSMLTLFFGLKIIHRVWQDEKPLLLFAFFFLIMPYFNMAARFGLESNLMLGFSTMFLYLFLKAVDTKRLEAYALCGVAGGVTLYTYAICYVAFPLFLLLMLAILLALHKINFKQILCFGAGMLPLALPLIAMVVINQFQLETLVIGPFTIPRLNRYRAREFSFPSFRGLMDTLRVVYIMDDLPFNSLPAHWTMYYLSPVLAALGFGATVGRVIKSLRARAFTTETVILGWFVSMLLLGSMLSGVNCNRVNGIFFAAMYFVVAGAYQLLVWAAKASARPLKVAARVLCVGCAGFYLFFGGRFLSTYLTQYKPEMMLFSPLPTEAIAYIQEDEALAERDIYYFSNNPNSYIDYLLATLPDPRELSLTVNEENGLFS